MREEWDRKRVETAAQVVARAEALIITAGAGMGVDSGLPDFRGREGFWRAYPAFARLGLDFAELANPRCFQRDPELAWGFYGHRSKLYRETRPHAGFMILKEWTRRMPVGHFVITSNVDGQFQKAGFRANRIYEVHGTIHRHQCIAECGVGLFAGDAKGVAIDEKTCRSIGPLPRCPSCGALARPNILMFGDGGWDSRHSQQQEDRLIEWLEQTVDRRLVVIECGAGLTIPTIRKLSELYARRAGVTLIRINPREAEVPAGGHLSLQKNAREALEAIDAAIVWPSG